MTALQKDNSNPGDFFLKKVFQENLNMFSTNDICRSKFNYKVYLCKTFEYAALIFKNCGCIIFLRLLPVVYILQGVCRTTSYQFLFCVIFEASTRTCLYCVHIKGAGNIQVLKFLRLPRKTIVKIFIFYFSLITQVLTQQQF